LSTRPLLICFRMRANWFGHWPGKSLWGLHPVLQLTNSLYSFGGGSLFLHPSFCKELIVCFLFNWHPFFLKSIWQAQVLVHIWRMSLVGKHGKVQAAQYWTHWREFCKEWPLFLRHCYGLYGMSDAMTPINPKLVSSVTLPSSVTTFTTPIDLHALSSDSLHSVCTSHLQST